MLQPSHSLPPFSPAVAAFWARNCSGFSEKSKNGLRAISKPKQQLKTKRPKLRSKNKGGGVRGNRNALKNGLHSKERRELRATVRRVVAEAKLAVAMARIEAARMDIRTTEILRSAGLTRRAIWPSEQ